MIQGCIDDNGTYLSNLIKDIIRSDECYWESVDSEMVSEFAKKFIEYYSGGNFNMYSASYKWLLDAEDGTDEYLSYRLGLIEEYLKKKEDASKNTLEKFTKLRDYITLEAARSKRYKSMEQLADQAKDNLSEIKRISRKTEEERKDAAGQTITVLSIFTGIAMAFFGGFSLLGSAFNNIAYGLPASAVMGVLIGIILFNTVFLFIYFASRISGHAISHCKAETCDACSHKCHKNVGKQGIHPIAWISQFNAMYPYILIVNALMVILLVVFVHLYMVLPYHGLPQAPSTATAESAQIKAFLVVPSDE